MIPTTSSNPEFGPSKIAKNCEKPPNNPEYDETTPSTEEILRRAMKYLPEKNLTYIAGENYPKCPTEQISIEHNYSR